MPGWDNILNNYSISTAENAHAAVFSPVRDALESVECFKSDALREILLNGAELKSEWLGRPIPWRQSSSELARRLVERSGLSESEIADLFPARKRTRNPSQFYPMNNFSHCPQKLFWKYMELFGFDLVHSGLVACFGRLGRRWTLVDKSEFANLSKKFWGRTYDNEDLSVARPWADKDQRPFLGRLGRFSNLMFIIHADLKEISSLAHPGPRTGKQVSDEVKIIAALGEVYQKNKGRYVRRRDFINVMEALDFSKKAADRCWKEAPIDDWRRAGQRPKHLCLSFCELDSALKKASTADR
ncbi:MAG: hypothetical protein AAF416_15875 [Pseudomonadota bacterium]